MTGMTQRKNAFQASSFHSEHKFVRGTQNDNIQKPVMFK